MPTRLSGSRHFKFDRILPGIGRFQASAQTANLSEFRRRDGILTKLVERGLLEPIRLLKADSLTWPELIEADRQDRLAQVAGDRKLDVGFWQAVGNLDANKGEWDSGPGWLPVSAPVRESRRRYLVSLRKLRTLVGEPRLTVRQLPALDWRRLRKRWAGSQADWNRMRAAVSSFLTWHFDDEYHPARVAVVRKIPWKQEAPGPMPTATAAEFWTVVGKTPEHAKAAYVAMAILGVYPKEYVGIRPDDLTPNQRTVLVNGTKSWARQRVVAVHGDDAWTWVERAIPAPLAYGWLRKYWTRACNAAGVRLPMRHLRHLSAQFAADGGASDRDLTVHLGHSNPATSHRYSRRLVARGVAKQISEALFPPVVPPAHEGSA